jgi:hypothetical protein
LLEGEYGLIPGKCGLSPWIDEEAGFSVEKGGILLEQHG